MYILLLVKTKLNNVFFIKKYINMCDLFLFYFAVLWILTAVLIDLTDYISYEYFINISGMG